jgi:hypothetical protein
MLLFVMVTVVMISSGNQDYCNFSIPLSTHYQISYGLSPLINYPPPHQNVPKTFTVLESVPEGHGFSTSWHTIESGQTAEYVAHEAIILKAGFHAKAGSNFTARIEPCANCASAMVMVRRIDGDGAEIEEEIYIAVGDNEEEQSEGVTATGELQVYPNPTTGLLTIRTENDNRIQMIELYSAQGEKLLVFSGNRGTFQEIDISHLPSQIYILKILVNGQIFTKRLILQK